ncbi:probable phytol kinase 2, chloroplastic isoform X3 [Aegilops tauschii subsp. strangulata]|uniref:probable phytol kinase 2, chloroplastic isoform X3 n=1 Tax=Aegilops tauschii subsp. strangulata TaxID=200361 RepID=UPI003CC840A9
MLRLSVHPFSPASSSPLHTCLPSRPLRSPTSAALTASSSLVPPSLRRGCTAGRSRRATTMAAVISPVGSSGLVQDLVSSALTAGVAHGLFHFIQGLVERGFCDLKLNRKLMHITIGMVPLLFWPLFREFLKAPLYYVTAIALATSVLWRTSPIAIALICNLCAGDGVADIVGRRLGKEKLPYNPKKSYAGSIAMAIAGFLASIGCMHYFHTFGFIEESWRMTFGFPVVSVAASLVQSHPNNTELDDNLTVPLASFLVGSLIL